MEMKAGRSFVKKGVASGAGAYIQAKGARPGSHGVSIVSSGLDDLDQIIGGGIPVGSLVMIMEDNEAPHHMLLLRYFMAQGLVHSQPLFFASPLPSPKAFLGTLPAIASVRESKSGSLRPKDSNQQDELRIAWQYRRYVSEQKALEERRVRQQELSASSWAPSSSSFNHPTAGECYEYCNDFDMRKPLERSLLIGAMCKSLVSGAHLGGLLDECKEFVGKPDRPVGGMQTVGRLALQSLCAPQCMQTCTEWELLSFLQALKGIVRTSNSVAVITFPASLLRPTIATRWQHFADILLSVEAVLDEDKEMAGMLTDYQEIVGFLRVHKLSTINTQVPNVPDANVHTMKVIRRKKLTLERLQFAPVDAVSGESGNWAGDEMLYAALLSGDGVLVLRRNTITTKGSYPTRLCLRNGRKSEPMILLLSTSYKLMRDFLLEECWQAFRATSLWLQIHGFLMNNVKSEFENALRVCSRLTR